MNESTWEKNLEQNQMDPDTKKTSKKAKKKKRKILKIKVICSLSKPV